MISGHKKARSLHFQMGTKKKEKGEEMKEKG